MSREVALPRSIVRNAVTSSPTFRILSECGLATFDETYEAIIKIVSRPPVAAPLPDLAPAVHPPRYDCAECGERKIEITRDGDHVCANCGLCRGKVYSTWTPPSPVASGARRAKRPRDGDAQPEGAFRPPSIPSQVKTRRKHVDDVQHWGVLAGLPECLVLEAERRLTCASEVHGDVVTDALIVACLVLAATPLSAPEDVEARMRAGQPLQCVAASGPEAPRFPCPRCGERRHSRKDARFHCITPSSMSSS